MQWKGMNFWSLLCKYQFYQLTPTMNWFYHLSESHFVYFSDNGSNIVQIALLLEIIYGYIKLPKHSRLASSGCPVIIMSNQLEPNTSRKSSSGVVA